MELKRIYASELLADWTIFQQTHLLFPFYSSHRQARTEYFSAVKKGHGFLLRYKADCLFVDKVVEKEAWVINNLLITAELNWKTAFLLLENAARREFKHTLKLKLKANLIIQQWLISQGYRFVGEVWQKQLVYQTGLVLGGGGARGAYQIGVWKALLEKNISFAVISGTSVGGLNGALIAQGEYDQAVALWEEIETDKVLEITFKEVEELDFSAQVDQLRTFIKTSLRQRGLSSAPLRRLLEERLDPQKIQQACPLSVVTTKVPAFQEIIVSLNQCPKGEIIDWLLASSAFFPMMAMAKIGNDFYVDGGYRNNLPVDVALQQGITEVIVVDVHGPGLDKKYRLPAEVAELSLASPWSLGDLLLFHSDRASVNIDLGYLETKRAFGELQGERYFFSCQSDFQRLTKDFLQKVKKQVPLELDQLYPELKKFFRRSVPVELLSLACLEFFAYWLKISPVQVFTPSELIVVLRRQIEAPSKFGPGISVQEQIEDFINHHNLFSDYHQVLQIYQQTGSWEQWYRRWPIQTLLALFFSYLQEEL